jgi:hypothetical protein
MLPIHPHPKADEILSCWMVRLAMGNGFKLHTFYAQILGYKLPIWNRDVDRHPQQKLIELLCEATGHRQEVLLDMSLLAYEGVLTASAKVAPDNPSWIIPLGVFHRKRRRDGMQFCPLCLVEDDATPYFRRHWRLALACICDRHGCLLQGHCPQCEQPISYHRLDFNIRRFFHKQPLSLCWHCRFDLRCASVKYIDCRDEKTFAWLVSIMDVFSPMQGFKWTQSGMTLSFYQGVMALTKGLSSTKGARLHAHLRQILGFGGRPWVDNDEFAKLQAEQRAELLLCVGYLLEEWPERLIILCNAYHLSRSRFIDYFTMMPWWVYQIVDMHLDGRIYIPSPEEVQAAIHFLQRRSLKVTVRNLQHYTGLLYPVAAAARKTYLMEKSKIST